MRLCLLALLWLLTAVSASAVYGQSLKIATWNLEHLADTSGEGCKPRHQPDYVRLQDYAHQLDADVIALQEVENEAAVARVFDPAKYRFELSRRETGARPACWDRPGAKLTPLRVGFAIRKGIKYTRYPDLERLAIGGRHGVDIGVRMDGEVMRLLAVHLKSGCFSNSEDAAGDPDCQQLNDQISLVEQWLDNRTKQNEAAVVLGDFNRRLTQAGDRLWRKLNDGEPASYTLLTQEQQQVCKGPFQGMPYIDHILVNPSAKEQVASSLIPLQYDEAGAAAPSDHCPIAVTVEF